MSGQVFGNWRWARRIVAPLIVFSAAMGLIAVAVLNPLAVALAQFFIALGGEPFAGNFDLLPFFSTLPGVLTIVVLAGSAIFLWAVRFGGLILIAWNGREGRTPELLPLSRVLTQRLPRLLLLSAFAFLAGVIFSLPVVAAAIAAKWMWLSGGDIYFYVSTRPPEFFRAILLVGAVALVMLGFGIAAILRWLMAVAFCTIGGAGVRGALRLSAERMKGKRLVLLARLALATGAIVLLSLVSTAVLTFLFDALFWPGQSLRTASRMLLVFGTCGTLAAALIAAIGHSFVAMICAEQYAAIGNPQSRPEPESGRKPPSFAVWAACLALPLVAAGQAAWTLEEFDLDEPVRVTAHRAGASAAPENTLAALDRAIADGADYAEIDVQETRDGEIIVFHDSDFRRIGRLDRPVWELDLAEVGEIDAGGWFGPEFAGERIPTLRAFAERSRGRIGLNVELKDNRHGRDLANRTLAILRETGVIDRVVITSLSLPLLAEVRSRAPDVRIGYIASTGVGNMLALDVDFYSLAARIASSAFIARARAIDRGTHVWDVGTQPAFVQAILDGAENLITDEPVLARETVREMENMTQAELTLLNLRRRLARAGLVSR